VNPPSSATSRGASPSALSSLTVCGSSVFSPGLPGSDAAGKIRPRAPRLVFGVTSAICATYPNSVGLPSLPLRIGLASGSQSEISRP